MSEFAGLAPLITALVPVFLLFAAFFYMGYRKSCRLTPLVLTQFFSFAAIMSVLFLLDINQIVTGRIMSVFYVLVVAVFYVGGATLTGALMRSQRAEETGQSPEREGER
ncbi:MAG: hypothetical protein SCK29_01700 [Bacillota bacterium]|nr:hypothetical protein [Bacillota bacterium]MDW7682815.1 hypothetical protein [Bacillota bacterium]